MRAAHLSRRHVERQRQAAGQLHHVCTSAVLLALLGARFDGYSLLRGDRRCGGHRGWHGHGSRDDGLVGAWNELDLTSLWHHLDGLVLNLRHHLVLDVGGGGGVGARRTLLNGEDDGAAGGRGAQAGRELDHIALG